MTITTKTGTPQAKSGYSDWYVDAMEHFIEVVQDLSHARSLNEVMSIVRKAARELTQREQRIRAVAEGQMWDGAPGIERIDVGRDVIFKVPTKSGDARYIVDNPGPGAIYLFKSLSEAQDVVTGFTRRLDARDAGNRFVIHSGDWKSKLAALLKDEIGWTGHR